MDKTTHIKHSRRSNGAGAGRDDCWTESGTETLIEAWGDRYLQLNRGNLRQKDWKEVADAVNANRDGLKAPRTDVQCKNRIDTLKKKYKMEKSKLEPSKWPFFHRLEHLIGTGNSATRKKLGLPRSVTTIQSKPKPDLKPIPNLKAVVLYGGSSSNDDSVSRTELEGEGVDDLKETTAFSELATAIVRFGKVYERIENSKQEQMMQLEKQRMEFTKELEFQRLNMFMETQLELEKMKKKKRSSAKGASSSPGKKLEP